jgi:hypothetical protein
MVAGEPFDRLRKQSKHRLRNTDMGSMIIVSMEGCTNQSLT